MITIKTIRTALASFMAAVLLSVQAFAPVAALADDIPATSDSATAPESASSSAADSGSNDSPSDAPPAQADRSTDADSASSSTEGGLSAANASDEAAPVSTPADSPDGPSAAAADTTSVTGSSADPAPTSDASEADDAASGAGDDTAEPIATQEVTPNSTTVLFQTSASDNSNTSTTTTVETTTATDTTSIATGDSYAIADILNLLNTNFVNSTGVIGFSNYLTTTGTIDARAGSILSSSLCTLTLPCTGGNAISLNFLNTASIDNQITLQAASGGNTLANASSGSITTGNAFAGLNLINLANTNFTNSNYYLLALNAFQSVAGDIVLPSLAHFFDAISAPSISHLSLTNDGTADNDVQATSDSGNNSTTATASTITTGSSLSYTNIFNQLNSDIVDNNLSVLLRIGGTWNGQIFGLPDGVSWTQTSDGILFSSTPFYTASTYSGGGSLSVNATNTAAIHNQVSLGAASGQNAIDDTDSAAITTGSALTAANVINVANTNIIGKNWMLAIINIFGDLNGNIAFGRPDLWVGSQIVNAPTHIQEGDHLTYKVTVQNKGDATASNAFLKASTDEDHLAIMSSSGAYSSDGGMLTWDLGALAPGASMDITYTATVMNAPNGTRVITGSHVTEHETDDNDADNTDSVIFYTTTGSGTQGGILGTQNDLKTVADPKTGPILKIVRTPATATPSGINRTVHETLTIENESDMPAKGIVLHDLTYAPDGTMIDDEPWDIGSIAPKEQVQVAYDAAFSDAAPSGTYTISTKIAGTNVPPQVIQNGVITLAEQAQVGEVLGTTTEPVTTATSTGILTVLHKQQSIIGGVLGAFTTHTAHASEGSPSDPAHSPFREIYFGLGLLLAAAALTFADQYWARKQR